MSVPSTGYGPIGSNTGFIFGAQFVSSGLRAIYAAVLARYLGPELFGLMNYGLGWYAVFLAIANLQLESFMSRRIALDPASVSEVLSSTATLRLMSTALVFAAAIGTAVSAGHDSLLTTVLLIYAVAMVGRSAAMWCASAFVSRESARHVFRTEIVFRIAEVLVGISALLIGFGLIEIALIHALSWWAQSVYGLSLVRSRLSEIRVRAHLREQVALFRAVLPMAVASIGATWLMQGPFVLFKGESSVTSDLGLVALVLQIFVLAVGVPVALGRAALPALSRTVARTDSKDALFLGLVLRAAFPGTCALIVGAAAAGDWVVPLIFGESYRAAGSHLIYGMMLVLPFGVATIANQILIAHDRAWQAMAASVLGAAAMTFFVLGFMPTGGTIAGYLLRVFAGISVWAITALVLLGRRVPLNWSQCLVKPALASGIALGLYYILVGPLGAWVSLVVSMLTLIALHRVLNIVDRQERAALSRYLLARTGR